MPTYRALEQFVSSGQGSRIIQRGEIFSTDAKHLPSIRDIIEPVDQEGMTALANAPQAGPSIGWGYSPKGGTGMHGRSGAFMWSGESG
jgi:hypothetical protein